MHPRTFPSRHVLTICTVLCSLVMIAGCSYSNLTSQVGPAAGTVPKKSDAICVMLAADPNVPASPYTEAGKLFSALTRDLIQRNFSSTQLLETKDESQAIKLCATQGGQYLVAPKIIHWGNAETVESRLLDYVAVELRLLLVPTKQLVKSIHYEGRNNSVTLSSTLPEALLDENYADAVLSLFQNP